MKNPIPKTTILFLLTLSYQLIGQDNESLKINKDSTYQGLIKGSKHLENDSLSNLLFEENWNTTSYNPYKGEILDYPFNIVFTDSTYTSPIARKKVITSRYGWRRNSEHKGIDIDLITGDNVRAMFDGKVRFVSRHAGHGKLVVIRHANGLETVYAHLSKQFVRAK